MSGPTAEVVGLHIFYENSAWDDPDGPGNPMTGEGTNEFDDDAIAVKQALLPGNDALFINYTSYNRGINGLMIDVEGLISEPTLGTIGSFFAFCVGNDDTYTSPGWVIAPAPIEVTVRTGDGELNSDRITIIWADNVIEKQWLEVQCWLMATRVCRLRMFIFGVMRSAEQEMLPPTRRLMRPTRQEPETTLRRSSIRPT